MALKIHNVSTMGSMTTPSITNKVKIQLLSFEVIPRNKSGTNKIKDTIIIAVLNLFHGTQGGIQSSSRCLLSRSNFCPSTLPRSLFSSAHFCSLMSLSSALALFSSVKDILLFKRIEIFYSSTEITFLFFFFLWQQQPFFPIQNSWTMM